MSTIKARLATFDSTNPTPTPQENTNPMSTTDSQFLSIDTTALVNGLQEQSDPRVKDFVRLFKALHVQGQPLRSTHGVLTGLITPGRGPAAWRENRTEIIATLTEALTRFDEWVAKRDAKIEAERAKQAKAAAKRTKDRERRLDLAVSALERVASKGTGEPVVEAARSLLQDVL